MQRQCIRDIALANYSTLPTPTRFKYYNPQLIAVGDIDGDDTNEVIISDLDGNIMIVKVSKLSLPSILTRLILLFSMQDTLSYTGHFQNSDFSDCHFSALDAFPLLDENLAEIILVDTRGILYIISCDCLTTGDGSSSSTDGIAALREVLVQDIDFYNTTAVKAFRYQLHTIY